MNDDNYIEIRKVNSRDFEKNILGGEIKPHDVEITVKFRDGTEKTTTVDWKTILDFYKFHGLSAVREWYEFLLE